MHCVLAPVVCAVPGTIPEELGQLTSLKKLALYDNKLTGTVLRVINVSSERTQGVLGTRSYPFPYCGLWASSRLSVIIFSAIWSL